MANFITSSRSNPRGLAYIAYGDPERYAQVKNQIKSDVYLSSSKLDSFSPELIKDCISDTLKELLQDKYSFISEQDIIASSEEIFNKIITEINSTSSYLDSVLNELLLFLNKKFSFISNEDSQEIMRKLFTYLRG